MYMTECTYMKVGDLVVDWYYPGFGLVIDIINESREARVLIKVYFSEVVATEWRYEDELVVISEKKS